MMASKVVNFVAKSMVILAEVHCITTVPVIVCTNNPMTLMSLSAGHSY
jgi:hypothetical protein